jgi:hypothetical protein
MNSQTASPRDSTFRRKTPAVLAASKYFSRNALEPDDDEFDAVLTPSKVASPVSPSFHIKPVTLPGLSTLMRQNRELLSQSNLEYDDDDDEPDMSPTPTKKLQTNLVGSTRGASVQTLRTSPLKSIAVVGVTDVNIIAKLPSVEHSIPFSTSLEDEVPASAANVGQVTRTQHIQTSSRRAYLYR